MVLCDMCGKGPTGKGADHVQRTMPFPLNVLPPIETGLEAVHICWPCLMQILAEVIADAKLKKSEEN